MHVNTLTVQATETKKNSEYSMSKMVYSLFFFDLKFPSLSAGLTNPCEYFPVACIISQIVFFYVRACVNNAGFHCDGHIYGSHAHFSAESLSQQINFISVKMDNLYANTTRPHLMVICY